MRKRMFQIFLGLVIIVLHLTLQIAPMLHRGATSAFAYWLNPSAGSTSATFLKIGIGPRAIAMGEAYVAVADDVSTIYWNPAGLVNVKNHEFYFMHNEWLQGMKHEFIGYAQEWKGDLPITLKIGNLSFGFEGEKSWGFALTGLFIDGMERRADENLNALTDPLNTFDALDAAAIISYSQRITEKSSWGTNLKIIQQRIDTDSAWGFAFDLGGLHRICPNFNLGWNLQNIGPYITFLKKGFPMPFNIKLGLAGEVTQWNTLFALDLNQPIDNYLSVSFGAEWRYAFLALRGGYKYKFGGNDLPFPSGLTAGVGIKFDIFQADYAFVPYGDLSSLGGAHRISLLIRF